MHNTVYSLGHSSHSWDHFYSLIQKPDIGVVLDVRSNPRSRLFQYNKAELRYRLNSVGVSYLYMGDQLGGRTLSQPTDYETMASSVAFSEGIVQVLDIAKRCKPALLCSEHEPLQCHRCLLVGRYLVEQHDVTLAHIMRDGRIELHRETEDRLLTMWGRNNDELFINRTEALAAAYRLQERKLSRGGRK